MFLDLAFKIIGLLSRLFRLGNSDNPLLVVIFHIISLFLKIQGLLVYWLHAGAWALCAWLNSYNSHFTKCIEVTPGSGANPDLMQTCLKRRKGKRTKSEREKFKEEKD